MDQTFSSEELARLRVLLQATSTVVSASPTGQISPPTTVSSPLVSLFSQPPSQSSSRSLTTQPPPIVHLYQSSRQQSLPQDQSSMAFASSSVPTARFQPYSGIGTLVHCPRAGPGPLGPRVGPGPALKGQGQGQLFWRGSALGRPWPYSISNIVRKSLKLDLILRLCLWYNNVFYYIADPQLYYAQIPEFFIKENINYLYLYWQFNSIIVLYSLEALIHCITVLYSIYNCYIINIIAYITCFLTFLKIVGPRVGPGPALTRPRPWGPGSGPAKISRPWPGPAPGQCISTTEIEHACSISMVVGCSLSPPHYHHQNRAWKMLDFDGVLM